MGIRASRAEELRRRDAPGIEHRLSLRTRTARQGIGLVVLAAVWAVSPVALAQESGGDADGHGEQVTSDDLSTSPDYPLTIPEAPCLGDPCGPFQLVDLWVRSSLGEDSGPRGGFRLRLGKLGFVGLEAGPGSRAATLRTARLEVAYRERDPVPGVVPTRRGVAMTTRLPRLRLDLRADEDARRPGAGWRVGATAAVRLSPELELLVRGGGHTGPTSPPGAPRLRRDAAVGLLWQPHRRLELMATTGIDRLAPVAGEEIRRWRFDTTGLWLAEPLRLEIDVGLAMTDGRLARDELEAAVELQVRPWRRLLLEVEGRDRVELGASELRRGVRVGATLHGRDHRFDRGALAAREVAELVSSARALGLNERRVYGTEEIRALRERLGVSGAGDRLRRSLDRLHGAVVADRNVGRAGIDVTIDRRFELDLTERRVAAFVALPWPPAPPWRGNADEVEFLRLSGSYLEAELSPGVTEIGRRWSLEARLHRELLVDVAWSRPARTALELAVGVQPAAVWTVGLAYAFER